MKHILFAILLAFSFCTATMAQSTMSDDQVMVFIKEQMDKGVTQQNIVAELLKKGVSTAQLQRVRQKAEKLKAEGSKAASATTSIKTNRTDVRKMETGAGNKAEEKALNEQDARVVEISEEGQRKVFGRDIFNNKELTFAPSASIATPSNYVMGPGDEVIINIWGASQQTLNEKISPDGYIVIAGVGPIKLAGMSVSKAKSTVINKLSQFYADCSFDLSVGDIRSIQVQVLGEVNVPGTYTLSSLSTAFNALYMAGGINQVGTLRDIKVYRQGRMISSIDIYDYLLNGNSQGDIRLHDNDVIIVGVYDCMVQIKGSVKRPMWYEMKKSETMKSLLAYSGGFNGNAYTKNVRLIRKSGNEYTIHTIDEFQMGAFNMSDEDRIEVDSIRTRFSNLVEVKGAAIRPGQFQLGNGIQTVKELIIAAEGLREDAYLESAVIQREKDDLTLEVVDVDIKGIMDGTAADIPLKNNDILYLPSKIEMLGDQQINIVGEVQYPGTYPYADNMTLHNLLLQAGGMTEAGSLAKIDVMRRPRDPNSLIAENSTVETFTFSLDEAYNLIQDTTFYLKPHDIVIVRKSPSYTYQKTIMLRGEANFGGAFPLRKKEYRLSDLIKDCGGLTSDADAEGASLTRQMTEEEIEQRNKANMQMHIQIMEDLLKDGSESNMQIADSLLKMKNSWSKSYAVAINLKKAMENPMSEHDIILKAGDLINIPEHNNTINISGEVMMPVAIPFKKGSNLAYYINHAGGYNENARRSKVYGINPNGSVVKLQSNSVNDIRPGMKIVVPHKQVTKKKMSTSEIVGITSGIASVAAIIVAIMNIIKK